MQESLDKLSNDIRVLQNSRAAADESTALTTRLEEVREKSAVIGKSSEQWKVLRNATVIKDSHQRSIAEQTKSTINAIKHAQELFAEPTVLIQHAELGELNLPVESFVEKVKVLVQQAWVEYQQHVESKIEIDPPALVAFAQMETFESAASEITALIREVRNLLAIPAENNTTITTLNTALDQLASKTATFFSRMPPEVVDFVRAAAVGGAAITELTGDVREWIKDNGLESNFSVRLTGTNN